ncbi:hypothetical protein BCE02nite_23320 [Brevibacillus centrosporus]|nr:hypothetical protein BCE02nite_23320 [Brevibacillus centrosporus]
MGSKELDLRASYRENGVLSLQDTRSQSSGRPLKGELTLEVKNARLEAQNRLLKAENELLKKIRFAERGPFHQDDTGGAV